MKSQILALAAFGCCLAFAQAPPQAGGPTASEPARANARELTIRSTASSEPNTAERQVGGLEAATGAAARPATAVMGFSAGPLGGGAEQAPAAAGPWSDRNSSSNGGPN